MRTPLRFTAVLGTLALVACNTDTSAPVSADLLLSTDVAAMAGEAVAQDVEVMRGPSGGPFGFGFLARRTEFDCAPKAARGLNITRTCVFKDANGGVQTAYDALTTASVTVHAELRGDMQRPNMTATIERIRDFTVSGLAGEETSMTWNGTGTEKATRVHMSAEGTARSMTLDATGTVTNVVIPVPQTPTSWPLSGTISKIVTVTKANGTTETRNVTITFNGTQKVPVVVNGTTFEFDLANRGRPRRPR